MTTEQIETKWTSIVQTGTTPYRSLRIDPVCVPELYLALDVKGERYLILQVPANITVPNVTTSKKYLTLEWHQDARFILIGVHDKRFSDLFNDLILSLYNRVKNLTNPEEYKNEFISCFYKWAEFFDDSLFGRLSDSAIKGLFGELSVLLWNISNATSSSINDALQSWQGPYGKAHDFVFAGYDLEVKTKSLDDVSVQISSEYQLETAMGKDIKLGVVNVLASENGLTLQSIVETIRYSILNKGGDLAIFTKALLRTGIGPDYVVDYSHIKFEIIELATYLCNADEFPKLVSTTLPAGVNTVKYCLNIPAIDIFLIEKIDFGWNSRNSLFTAGRF